jgi:hypothetical protein
MLQRIRRARADELMRGIDDMRPINETRMRARWKLGGERAMRARKEAITPTVTLASVIPLT